MIDQTFLDWPFLEDRHRKLKRELDEWCARQDFEHVGGVDAICRRFVSKLGAAGFLRTCVGDLDVRSLALSRETLAYHSGLADFAFAMQGLGSGPVSLFGSRAQKRRVLDFVACGEAVTAFALSEADAGSDVAAIATTAEGTRDGFVLNGEKTWISNAGIADFYCVFARTGEGPGARGLSAFLVEASNPGLRITARIETVAPHPLGTMTFEDCRISKEDRIGGPGEGFKVAMATLDIFRTTVGAAALGFARRALSETVGHTTTRHLFGEPLSELQMTQATVADLACLVDASALLVYRSAWARDCRQNRVTREAAMAKLYATEAAQQVIDKTVQLFGGKGVTKGNIAESLYREIRALRIYEGASEIQKVIIARQTYKEQRA